MIGHPCDWAVSLCIPNGPDGVEPVPLESELMDELLPGLQVKIKTCVEACRGNKGRIALVPPSNSAAMICLSHRPLAQALQNRMMITSTPYEYSTTQWCLEPGSFDDAPAYPDDAVLVQTHCRQSHRFCNMKGGLCVALLLKLLQIEHMNLYPKSRKDIDEDDLKTRPREDAVSCL